MTRTTSKFLSMDQLTYANYGTRLDPHTGHESHAEMALTSGTNSAKDRKTGGDRSEWRVTVRLLETGWVRLRQGTAPD